MSDIIRVFKKDAPADEVSHHLRNETLSLEAVGLMCRLLNLPSGQEVSIGQISTECREEKEKILEILQELITAGYAIHYREDAVPEYPEVRYYIIRENPDVIVPEMFLQKREQEEDAETKVCRRIDYQKLLQENDKETVQEIVRLLVCYEEGKGSYAFVNGEKVSARTLQEKFRGLISDDVEQVLFSVATTEVKNLRNYLISALYRKVKNERKLYQKTGSTKKRQEDAFCNFKPRYNAEEMEALERQLLSIQ